MAGSFGGASQGLAGTINAVNSGANIAINVRQLREDIESKRYEREKELKEVARLKSVRDEQYSKLNTAMGSTTTSVEEYENLAGVQESGDYSEKFNTVFDNMMSQHGSNRDVQTVLDKYSTESNMGEAGYKKFKREANIAMAQAKYRAVNNTKGYKKVKTFVDPLTGKEMKKDYYDPTAYATSQAHLGLPVDPEQIKKMWDYNEKVDKFFDDRFVNPKDLMAERNKLANNMGELAKVSTSTSTSTGKGGGGGIGSLTLGSNVGLNKDGNPIGTNVAEQKPLELLDLKEAQEKGGMTDSQLQASWQSSTANRIFSDQMGEQHLTAELLRASGNKLLLADNIYKIVSRARPEMALPTITDMSKALVDGNLTKEQSGVVHEAFIHYMNDPSVPAEERLEMNSKLAKTTIPQERMKELFGTGGGGETKSTSSQRSQIKGADKFADRSMEQFNETIKRLNLFDTADYNSTLTQNPDALLFYKKMKDLMGD